MTLIMLNNLKKAPGVIMIPFPEYIKKYKTETIHGIIEHDKAELKRTSRGGLRSNLKTKIAYCENELERRREEEIYE